LRCFVAGDGKPRSMTELVAWAFPEIDRHECWHRWSARRALLKIARPIGRSPSGRGRPGIWSLDAIRAHGAKPIEGRTENPVEMPVEKPA
jgi:hypothetical protein